MADLTWFEVEQFAPELGSGRISPAAQNIILGVVNKIITSSNWSDGDETSQVLKEARLLYAAHCATLARRKGAPGATTGRSMGGMSESWSTGPVSTSFLSTTSYGQLYITLARTRKFRAGFSTGLVGGQGGPSRGFIP